MNIKWDADKYTADFSFVHQYGNSVMELIDADKGSSALDLGCGNGALTTTLQEKGYAGLSVYKANSGLSLEHFCKSKLINVCKNNWHQRFMDKMSP